MDFQIWDPLLDAETFRMDENSSTEIGNKPGSIDEEVEGQHGPSAFHALWLAGGC